MRKRSALVLNPGRRAVTHMSSGNVNNRELNVHELQPADKNPERVETI